MIIVTFKHYENRVVPPFKEFSQRERNFEMNIESRSSFVKLYNRLKLY